jgi:hypothetical protein
MKPPAPPKPVAIREDIPCVPLIVTALILGVLWALFTAWRLA